MLLTLDQLSEIYAVRKPSALQPFLAPLNQGFTDWEINTKERISMFLAQIGAESGELATLVENLNYSAERLLQVFPSHFDDNEVAAFAHQPEKIANRVYADRLGNGNEASGDGWRYRGRGSIQITGKTNYSDFAKAETMDLKDVPAYLETPEGAIEAGCWFWDSRDCNSTASNIVTTTHKINGGDAGLSTRTSLWRTALRVLT